MSDDGKRLDEAVAWHVRLNFGDADEAAWTQFTTWLEVDDANRAAYDRVEDLDDAIGPAAMPDPALLQFQRPAPARRTIWIAGAALAAMVVLAVGISMRTNPPSAMQYTTQTGEIKTIALIDGSTVTLNTRTTIVTTMSRDSRAVTVEGGEALFHVAKDPSHPFVVTAGDRSIRVTGTVFDVLRDAGVVTVVVAEGKVAVSQQGGVARVDLTPGQRAKGREGSALEIVEPVNAARALAWREGYLIYDGAPLSAVVNDLNRYFPVPISIAGRDVAVRRFSGVLKIEDESAVLAHIAQFLPVRAERTPTGIVLHAAAKPD